MSRAYVGWGFVGLCVAVTAGSLFWSLQRTYSLQRWSDGFYWALVGGQLIALGLEAFTAVRMWRNRGRSSGSSGRRIRAAFCVLVLGAIVYLSFFQPFKALFFLFYWGIVAGLLAAVPLLIRASHPGRFRWLEVVLFNVCISLLGFEIGLRGLAMVSRSPLLARVDSIEDTMSRYRFKADRLIFGFRCNSDGFNDEEWDEDWTGSRVALIGDSFVVGVVPRALHFSSVAEELLKNVKIECMGINGAGPGEYAVLAKQALERNVDLVMVAFFVGNDFEDSLRFQPTFAGLRSWFDRENVLIFSVWTRLRVVLREQEQSEEGGVGVVQGQIEVEEPEGTTTELEQRYPWISNVALEKGTFSEEAFFDVEKHRFVGTCSSEGVFGYESTVLAMKEIVKVCGETPVVVAIFPDEFQVEDDLWSALARSIGDHRQWDREQPQRKTAELLEQLGVDFVDLLEPLRGVDAMSDGRRHVYHLRDTHLNARGNAVAGRTIAGFLSKRLGSE